MTTIKILALAAIVLMASNFSIVAQAADIYLDENEPNKSIHLDGEIRRGDAERLAIAMTEAGYPIVLLISSSGGDMSETMKMVPLIKGTHMAVYVAKGKVCASSCFFIYLSGMCRGSGLVVNDDGTLWSQEKRDRSYGAVGIHRPYFKDPSGKPESPKNQLTLMHKVKIYLEEEGIAQYIIDMMMTHPSNEIYWLRERDISAIGEYPPDIEETAISKCGYVRLIKSIEDKQSHEQSNEIIQCVIDEVLSAYEIPRTAYVAKLRTGWRPWKKVTH